MGGGRPARRVAAPPWPVGWTQRRAATTRGHCPASGLLSGARRPAQDEAQDRPVAHRPRRFWGDPRGASVGSRCDLDHSQTSRSGVRHNQ